jgi:tRNA A-37 threonylcarbamoyl transferase component Bud32
MNLIKVKSRIKDLTGITVREEVRFSEDISDYMSICRGTILDFKGEQYFIMGIMRESRFTLEDFPKFWVKSTVELSTGKKKLIKWDFQEEFKISIGQLRIKCVRSAEKEGRILELTKNNSIFMHGKTVRDIKGKPIHILDFIKGLSLYEYISGLRMDHETFFFEEFPEIFLNLKKCFEAIKFLHENNYVHGDIRTDHIIMDADLNIYRWIDFDLHQDFSDFDIWRIGNVLLFCTGKGSQTFQNVSENKKIPKKILDALSKDDASAFLKHMIANLGKLFPYIPKKLNDILMHFSQSTKVFYDNVDQIIDDMGEVLEQL